MNATGTNPAVAAGLSPSLSTAVATTTPKIAASARPTPWSRPCRPAGRTTSRTAVAVQPREEKSKSSAMLTLVAAAGLSRIP